MSDEEISKRKITLRRYLRLKRSNYIRLNEVKLTDDWYAEHYAPKIQKVIEEHSYKFGHLSEVVMASYNPMKYELNITPVIRAILQSQGV